MSRPTVVHVARDWVRPSEGFVADLVRSVTATRPVVAYGTRWPGAPGADLRVRSYAVDPAIAGRLRWDTRQRTRRALLAAVAVAERATVLHAHFGYWAELTAVVARRLRRPWMVSLHGHDLLVEARGDRRRMAVLREAALVAVPSRFLADAASDAGVPDRSIRVLPSGIDLSRLPFRERQPASDGTVVVTFAGRFVEKKGVLAAARAVAEVQGRHPKVHARFVGFGPLEPELRRVLREAGTEAEVLDGGVPGAVAAALSTTHLVVTPSRTASDGDAETLGLVNIEAQACGVPVVTTRHGGIPEAVAPDGALLVDEGDGRALVAALEELATSPERWPAMGRAGREHVALRFELGACVAEVEEHYLTLARRGAVGAGPLESAARWPQVSVVVPTFQRRELLHGTLDALERQTYPHDRVEVIIADDGSTDGTVESVAARSTPWRLEVVRNERHESAAAARNRALHVATGEVVAFTDDDCRPVPTWLEALVAGMRGDVDIVQGRTGPDPSTPVRPLARTQWTSTESGLYETCNIAYRRTALERVPSPPFRDDPLRELRSLVGPLIGRLGFGEDTDLAWRVKEAGGRTRFAVHAIVHHHVFPADAGYLLRRAWLSAGFPLLVRDHPELRSVLWGGAFLAPRRARFLAAAVGALLGVSVDRRAWLLAAPYVWRALRTGESELRGHLKAMPALVIRDTVETVALAIGSVHARRIVL